LNPSVARFLSPATMAPKAKAKTKAAAKTKAKAKAKPAVKPLKLKLKAPKAAPAKAAGGKMGCDAEEVKPEHPLAHRFYGDTQAFIAVASTIAPNVLSDGYKVEVRDHVPCSSVPMTSVKALAANWPDVKDCLALEVHGVPAKEIDVASGRVLTKHLKPQYLRDGVFMTRDAGDYTNAPCPLCAKKMSDKADQRGQVGLRRYVKQAFLVSPCDNPACVQLQIDRQKRLDSGKTLWLYHITKPASAALIKKAGGKMVRGAYGNAGGGIYFGLSAKDCVQKAKHKGVILKCRVQIGQPLDEDKCSGHNFAKLIKSKKDCVWGKIGYKTKSYILYSWDQVSVACAVDKDDKLVG